MDKVLQPRSLVCKDKKVLNFYDEHPNVDFESMNIIFVDIMNSLSQDMTAALSNNMASQLLNHIKSLQSQVATCTESVNKNHADTVHQLSSKFADLKREYLDDVRLIMSSNTADKVAPLIKEYNSIMLDKTFIMINDLIPKNNDNLTKNIQDNMKSFHSSITADTHALLKQTMNQSSLEEFLQNIDTKFSNAASHSQQLINSIITSTEQRLDARIHEIKTSTEKNITDIKDISTSNQTAQLSLHSNVAELLKKMEISSVKGKCSENILFHILQSLYSTAQIDVVGDQKETGDIILTRKNKPTILIENKNWNKNVIQDEVKKFIRDVETQNCCGLFLSQNFGVANKDNFEINVHDGNILLYVHEVNNDAEKIKTAIDIIDNFKTKLDEVNNIHGNGYNIDKEILDDINKEYQLFATQKMIQIKTIKDFSNKMIKQVEEIQLPSLDQYLSSRYAFSSSKYICDVCEYVAKNQSAMSAHKRGCKAKTTIEPTTTTTTTTPIEEIVLVEPPVIATQKQEDKVTTGKKTKK